MHKYHVIKQSHTVGLEQMGCYIDNLQTAIVKRTISYKRLLILGIKTLPGD